MLLEPPLALRSFLAAQFRNAIAHFVGSGTAYSNGFCPRRSWYWSVVPLPNRMAAFLKMFRLPLYRFPLPTSLPLLNNPPLFSVFQRPRRLEVLKLFFFAVSVSMREQKYNALTISMRYGNRESTCGKYSKLCTGWTECKNYFEGEFKVIWCHICQTVYHCSMDMKLDSYVKSHFKVNGVKGHLRSNNLYVLYARTWNIVGGVIYAIALNHYCQNIQYKLHTTFLRVFLLQFLFLFTYLPLSSITFFDLLLRKYVFNASVK